MSYNFRVKTFVTAAGTFTVGAAQGCYVEQGSADGPVVVNRMTVLGTGAIHDMDGTGEAALVPPVVWQDIVFQGANPGAHTQYNNLMTVKGWYGILTVEVAGASAQVAQAVAARLVKVEGSWEAPWAVGRFNTLTVRAHWQLKGLLD